MSNLEKVFFEGGNHRFQDERGTRLFHAWGMADSAIPVDLPGTRRKHKSALWLPTRINQHGEALAMLSIPSEKVSPNADALMILFHSSYFYGVMERLVDPGAITVRAALDVAVHELKPGATDSPFRDACNVLYGYVDMPLDDTKLPS